MSDTRSTFPKRERGEPIGHDRRDCAPPWITLRRRSLLQAVAPRHYARLPFAVR